MTEMGTTEKEPYTYGAIGLFILLLLSIFFIETKFFPPFNSSAKSFGRSPAIDHAQHLKDISPSDRFVIEGNMDINDAGAEEFALLPGIGEKTAKMIVEKRTELGGFSSVWELKKVKGISEARLKALLPYIRVQRVPAAIPPARGGRVKAGNTKDITLP